MKTLEPTIEGYMQQFLIPADKIWQPSDFLPDSTKDTFFDEVTELREEAKELGQDFWAVLVGDTITEEALPTYESWLMCVEGVDLNAKNGWSKWVSTWTAEENRHGDVLNKYLYLSGRVNMREMEISTQHLIADGFDIGTDRDPYRNFIYTSFQELATNISHQRVAKIAAQKNIKSLSKMCKIIAGDEMRHYLAYREFVRVIFTYDPNEMMLAVADMFQKKIVMPARYLRESGMPQCEAFVLFSDAAQRLGVYTFRDYIDIMNKLITFWKIGEIDGLKDDGKKARDYIISLPARLLRIGERIKIPEAGYQFKWVHGDGVV
ncbi:UNVERIFIED_CONTAM: hypothetical protein GTU68_002086 [Idotea baltica]|nr:hypothetical protein [Idotea baltica]